MKSLALIDVGLGNLHSVERAFRRAAEAASIEVEVRATHEPDAIAQADAIIFPGQGGFSDCARAMQGGVGAAILDGIGAGRPYFGICLGLQILLESSDESRSSRGLALLEGHVARLDPAPEPGGRRRKVPHIGWNGVTPKRADTPLGTDTHYYYFVHSYAAVPKDESWIASVTDYGGAFVSAIAKENVFACQFHPEKSQRAGLLLVQRWFERSFS